MTEIQKTQQLLDANGALQTAGYSKHMNFVLDKNILFIEELGEK